MSLREIHPPRRENEMPVRPIFLLERGKNRLFSWPGPNLSLLTVFLAPLWSLKMRLCDFHALPLNSELLRQTMMDF